MILDELIDRLQELRSMYGGDAPVEVNNYELFYVDYDLQENIVYIES